MEFAKTVGASTNPVAFAALITKGVSKKAVTAAIKPGIAQFVNMPEANLSIGVRRPERFIL